jgi:hypothetical protein
MKATCLVVASLFLAVSPVFADSVNSITIDYLSRAGTPLPLTPSTVAELTGPQGDGLALFQATLPSNWTRGEAFTFAISFDGQTFGASGNAYMPGYIEFGFQDPPDGISLPGLTQEYPATVTVSFANGGSATESFIIAPVPEPATWAFLATGLLGLAAVASRRRQRSPLTAGQGPECSSPEPLKRRK